MPAAAAAPSTGSTPILNRNTATIAADGQHQRGDVQARPDGHVERQRRSSRNSRTSPNKAWSANQTPRLAMTPTTAAVIADSAPDSARLPRSRSMNGAPRKIHRKQGSEGHPGGEQPAERRREQRVERAGVAVGAEEADELGDHDQRPGRRLGHAEAVEHLAAPSASHRSRPPAARHRRAPHRRRRRSPPPFGRRRWRCG